MNQLCIGYQLKRAVHINMHSCLLGFLEQTTRLHTAIMLELPGAASSYNNHTSVVRPRLANGMPIADGK